MSFNKKQMFILLLLFLLFILNGCMLKDKETYKTQIQAYEDEEAFYKNSLRVINKCFVDIGEDDTASSASAVKELSIQMKLIEERYLSSNFDEIVPCKDATNFIKFNLDAVRLGKSAVDNISKYYKQDKSSFDWSASNWYAYVSDISNVYSNFTYAAKKLETIRNNLEQEKPIK
ncbi:MAG: hypothetical protein GX818_02635 [Tissierellia bacterium]|nr:hypothetical protein [Tissierellia bacterium]